MLYKCKEGHFLTDALTSGNGKIFILLIVWKLCSIGGILTRNILTEEAPDNFHFGMRESIASIIIDFRITNDLALRTSSHYQDSQNKYVRSRIRTI
jgi:hypothetical protein